MIQFTHLDVNELMIQKCKRTYDIYQIIFIKVHRRTLFSNSEIIFFESLFITGHKSSLPHFAQHV